MKAVLILRAVASDDLVADDRTARMGASRGRAMRRAQSIKAKAWVAKLTPHLGAIKREFVRGTLDHSRPGGAYVTYLLDSGNVYEVSSPTSPFEAARYYCRVNPETGDIEQITQHEVQQWLSANGGTTSG